MEKWYNPAILAIVYLFLAASFIIPGIRLLKQIRSNGVSKDTYFSLILDFTTAMVVSVALTIYTMIYYGDEMIFYWTVSGLIILMITHLNGLRLYVDKD